MGSDDPQNLPQIDVESQKAPKRHADDVDSSPTSTEVDSVAKKARTDCELSELLDSAESTGNCAPIAQWIRRNPFGISVPSNPLWRQRDLLAKRVPVLCEKALAHASPSAPSAEDVCEVLHELLNRCGYASEIGDRKRLVKCKAHEVAYECVGNTIVCYRQLCAEYSEQGRAKPPELDIKYLAIILRLHDFTDFYDDYTEIDTTFWRKPYFDMLLQYAPALFPTPDSTLTHLQWEALQLWIVSFLQLLGKFVVYWGVPIEGGVGDVKDLLNMGLLSVLSFAVDCILHFDKIHGGHISAKTRGDLLEEVMRVVSVITSGLLDEIEDEEWAAEAKVVGRQIVPVLLKLLKCRIPTFHGVAEDSKKTGVRDAPHFSAPQDDRQQDSTWITELCEKCDGEDMVLTESITSQLPELYAEIADLPAEEKRYRFDCTAPLLSRLLSRPEIYNAIRSGNPDDGLKTITELLCSVLKLDGSAVDGPVEFVLFQLNRLKRVDANDVGTQTNPINAPVGSMQSVQAEDKENTSAENIVGGNAVAVEVKQSNRDEEAQEKMHKEELNRMIPLGAHILDFEAKRSYLQMRFERHRADWNVGGEPVRLVVPRDNVTDGVCNALGIGSNRGDQQAAESSRIDVPLEIEFRAGYRNEEGEEMVEEGEDQGGLRRQWLDRAARYFIQSNLFCQPENNPHRASASNLIEKSLAGRVFMPASVPVCKMVQDDWEDQFELFGCVVGFALLYKEMIPVHFTHSFLKLIFCKDNSLQDHLAEVECMDKMLYQKMKYILHGEYKSFSSLEEALELSNLPTTFSVAESHCVELVGNTDLCPDGSQKKVTEENKEEFVMLFLRQYLVESMRPQRNAFLRGILRAVPQDIVDLMSAILTVREIELMLCGTDKVDIDDWQKHTCYENGYTEDSPQIKWFWEVIRSWKDPSLCLELLSFTTGSSQVPTGGFRYLQPEPFTIQRVAETNRMVEAHTCANMLDLPMYESKEKLDKMLTMTLKEGGDAFGRK